MASNAQNSDPEKRKEEVGAIDISLDWTSGLRQIYDSVVDEPIPDSFRQIIAQLGDDEPDNKGDSSPPSALGRKA